MSSLDERDESRLVIELEPDLRKRVEVAAAEHGVSVKEYVAAALREALEHHRGTRLADPSGDWSRLSIPSFTRDWDSDADAIYDDLAER